MVHFALTTLYFEVEPCTLRLERWKLSFYEPWSSLARRQKGIDFWLKVYA